MRLVKSIKFIYGDETKIFKFRTFYIYETINPEYNKPKYFLSNTIVRNMTDDMVGGIKTYNTICEMNAHYHFGYFLETLKEVLLQAELDFVSELFAESQLGSPKMLKMESKCLGISPSDCTKTDNQ